MDVYVDENFRKKGIGQLMINNILKNEELKDVYQWLLITKEHMKFTVNPDLK